MIVAQFAFVVAILSGTQSVLGPLVADAQLGGARSWGVILAAEGAGAVLGGFAMIRYRPRRIAAVLTAGAILIAALTAAVLLVPAVRTMQRRTVSPGRAPGDEAAEKSGTPGRSCP